MIWRMRAIIVLAASLTMTAAASAQTSADRVGKILSGAIASCWNVPPQESQNPPTFSIRFKLAPDGSVEGRPEPVKTQMSEGEQQFMNGGIRAILKCSPYKHLPTSGLPYADWQDVIFHFDPGDLL